MSGKVAFISENTIYFYSSLYFCRYLEAIAMSLGLIPLSVRFSFSLLLMPLMYSMTFSYECLPIQSRISVRKKKQGNLNSFKNIYYTPYLILYKQNFNIYLAQDIYVYMLSIDAYIDQTLLRYEFYLNK